MTFQFKKFIGYAFLVILAVIATALLYLEKFAPNLFSIIPENLMSALTKIIISVLILSVLKLITGSISAIVVKEMEKRKIQEQEIFFMNSLFKILYWILAVFAVLSVFFENVGSFITALGLIGAGLAIALQHPILNFISWMIILFNKPFSVGDRIEIESINMDIRGDVIDITPFYTKIRKLTKSDEKTGKLIHVPNELLILNSVTNYAKGTGFIWDRINFNMVYDSDIKKLKEIILKTTEEILSKYKKLETVEKRKFTDEKVPEKPSVWIELQKESVMVGVSYLIEARNKLQARAEITEAIYEAIKKQPGISFYTKS